MQTDTLLDAPPDALLGEGSSLTLSGLDPAAAALGRMVGLLKGADGDALTVDPAWFQDPVANTSRGLKDDPGKVADLLAQLLGEVGGRAVGVPVTDPAREGSWYPIQDPRTGRATGLHVVSYERGGARVFGLGALARWTVSAAPAATVNAWGLVPVVLVGKTGVKPVLNVPGHPITVGIAVEADPLVDTHGFRFNGVKVSAELDVAAVREGVRIAISVLQLQLPGDDAPSDRSLADLAAIPGTQLIETASSLFLAALGQVSEEAERRAAYLLPVLGLSATVPKNEAKLPLLRWDQLFALATKPDGDVTEPFRAWFQAFTANPEHVCGWLGCVAGLLGSTSVRITGDGSRGDPFTVPVVDLTASKVGVLSFTLASVVDAGGARRLYPGLAFQAVPREIGKAELRLGAELEVAEFVLTDGTPRTPVPTLRFDAGMRLASPDAGQPLAEVDGFRFGALEAGVSLGLGSALVPAFRLVDVATPETAFDQLDLLSPGQLAEAGGIVLEAALRKLLGVADESVPFASNVAALLGVIDPRVSDGVRWPAELAGPFTRARIGETFKDPLGAMARWYHRVLTATEPVDGKTAFTWVLQELAGLLAAAQGAVHPEVTGDGTAAEPWRATLAVGDGTLPAALTGYREAAEGGVTRLVLGIEMAPELKLGDAKVIPSITAHFLTLDLPDPASPGRVTGLWGRDVEARIDLPDGFTTPAIATAKLEVKRASLSARWSRTDGWHWSLFAGKPALWIGDTKVPLDGDLDFSDAASFRELVTKGEKTFAPLLTGVAGAALLRTHTRAGTAAAGILGLLPEIDRAPVYPKGLDWPKEMPRLALTGLADPRPALRAQLAAVLSKPETAKPALGLLGWVLNPKQADVPTVEGGGTLESPWRVPVAGSGFEALAWYGHGDAKALGLGAGRTDVFRFGGSEAADRIEVTVATRLAAAEVSLATGELLKDEHAPGLSFITTVARGSGKLAELPAVGASLGRVVFGLAIHLDRGDGSAPARLVVSPVVTLEEVTLPGGEVRERLTIDDLRGAELEGALRQAFVALVDAGLQAAVEHAGVADTPGFKTAWALLTALGLTLEKTDEGRFGINPAGWQALLADPTTFAKERLRTLLVDVALRGALFDFIRDRLDLDIPDVPRPAAVVLEALGFVGPEAEGFPLRPEALLELARNPFATLSARFERLVTDADARQALITALGADAFDGEIGPVKVRIRGGTEITFELDPSKAIDIAGVIHLSGSVTANLADRAVGATLRVYNPTLQLSLVPGISARLVDGAVRPAFTARIEWGDGTKPAAQPLTLVPFDQKKFLDELAALAPPYVLNVVVGAVLESRLVERYPLVRQVFEALGIARFEPAEGVLLKADADIYALGGADGRWTVESILGLLRDPRGWLLSNGILGKDGQFDIASFGAILRRLPEVRAANGLGVERTATGARVVGLPYGFKVEMGSTAELATLGLSTGGFEIAKGKGKVEDLGLTVTLGANWQPGVKGRVTLATGKGFTTTPYYVTAGFDGAFLLEIGERPEGIDPPAPLRILPFQGWGPLVEQGARRVAPALLREVTPRLLKALHAQGGTAAEVAKKLETVGEKLEAAKLLAALAATEPFTLEEIERTALKWLLERFDEEHAADTALAVAAVFEGLVSGIDTVGGLVRYRPSEKLPLELLVGVDSVDGTRLLGAWADVSVPASVVRVSVKRTGVGIPVPKALPASLAALGPPVFSFGAAIRVPVDGEVGPELALTYDQKRVVLAFDPLGGGDADSALRRELLPEFFPQRDGDDADRWKRLLAWLLGVSSDVLPRYISSVVLNEEKVKGWLEAPIIASEEGAPRPVDVLKATSLLIARDVGGVDRYYLNALGELKKLTPETFLGNFLRALLRTRLTLLRFGQDQKGRVVIGPSPNDATRFGLLVAAPNLAIPRVENVVLQLGAEDTEWLKGADADVGKLEAGISLYVPVVDGDTGLRPRFQDLELNLVNVGLDVKGKGKAPLVDHARFKLGAVKPRALVTLRMKDWSPTVGFGAGVTLSGIGISLAPNALAGSGGSNPVAKNLLGSGTEDGAANPPTNPTFSVSAAYARKLWVRLHGDGEDPTRVVLPVQRSFGPLYVGSIGLGWKDADRRLEVLFSGRVALAGLQAEVMGLAVGIPVTRPTDLSAYTAELAGLDLSFRGGAVEIGGGLLKQENPLAYTGMILLKASKFSLVGLGSYALIPIEPGENPRRAPSLFLFAALRAPLGGHPAFFITGLAAGVAFNRNLLLPSIGEVHTFPLVKGVVDGSFSEGQDPGSALEKLAAVAKPEVGQFWLAAGITFTTFKLLDSAALLFLRMGREWEVALIGLSRASLPPEVPRALALAYIELAFRISIRPSDGVITAEAQLTPNSYVISKDCKLTGGFAFYLWFRDVQVGGRTVRAGDFVVTLGGYHPAFKKPDHYPAPPRLGFAWQLQSGGGTVSIGGNAYFALTPTAVMAGGQLRVTFQAGPLRAWLEAYANFLVEWKPFWYQASIGVSVGVAFQTRVLGVTITLKVELGAELWLAGPPTHGQARVSWWVVSFTIPFGDQNTATSDRNLKWSAFEEAFLPAPRKPDQPRLTAASDPYPRAGQQVVKVGAEAGLLRQDEAWVVRPVGFALRVETAVPTKKLTVGGTDFTGAGVGVRPMGVTAEIDVPLTVTVKGADGKDVDLGSRGVTFEALRSGAPAALWSRQPLDRKQVPDPARMVIEGALVGVVMRAEHYLLFGDVPAFPIGRLEYRYGTPIELPLARPPAYGPAPRYPEAEQKVAFRRIRETVMAPPVVAAREAAFAVLRAADVAAPATPSLAVMASAADLLFTARPVLARIGVYQAARGAPADAPPIPLPRPRLRLAAALREVADDAPAAPELQGIRRRYAQPAPPPEIASLRLKALGGGDAAPLHPPAFTATSESWSEPALAAPSRGTRSRVPAADGGVTLYDGSLALWKLDPETLHAVRHAGELPALATCFDAYGDIVGQVALDRGAASPLPGGTGQVALHGGVMAPSAAVGWERETALTKANPAYALGDGFALRTQNINRARRFSQRLERGTIDAARLLDDNVVDDVAGERAGWIETVFFAPHAFFAVVVESPGDAAAAVHVRARRSAQAGDPGGDPLAPTSQLRRDGATVLVFAAPEAAEGEDAPFLSVLVSQAEPDARVLGMWAFDRPPRLACAADVSADPSTVADAMLRAPRAAGPALDLETLAPPRARVSIITVSVADRTQHSALST